jgi:hypothetical protein
LKKPNPRTLEASGLIVAPVIALFSKLPPVLNSPSNLA